MISQRDEELKSTSYEVFILALSILSIINWILYFILPNPDVIRVILSVDLLISVIFLGDFLFRLLSAKSKRRYFFRQLGWLDLLGSLPFPQVKIARLSRIFRAFVLLRKLGVRNLIDEFFFDRANSAVYIVCFLIILVLEFGSASMLAFEQGAPGANIETASEALWWSIVTMSTVGYGDYTPVTQEGRLIGILVILVGVALFGVVTGFLANKFVGAKQVGEEMETAEPGSPDPGDIKALLQEIKALQDAQEHTFAQLQSQIEGLKLLLQENRGKSVS